MIGCHIPNSDIIGLKHRKRSWKNDVKIYVYRMFILWYIYTHEQYKDFRVGLFTDSINYILVVYIV